MKLALGIGLLIGGLSLFAQSPPIVVTNVVTFSPTTTLLWNPSTNTTLAGYKVSMFELLPGTNRWDTFTTTTNATLQTINSTVKSGTYRFEVRGVNQFGQEGLPGTATTNISVLPTIIVNVRVEVTP